MTGRALRVVAVNAGLGQPSSTRMLVDRTVDAVVAELGRRRVDVELSVVDLREHAVDIARSMNAGFATGSAAPAVADVEAADMLIVATPVFNGSYSGLFKSFVDLLDRAAMDGTPVIIAATGGSPRHSMVLDHALRPLFAFLRAVVVPTGVYAAQEDWAQGDGAHGDGARAVEGGLLDRIDRAAAELVALVPMTSPAGPVAATSPNVRAVPDDQRTASESAGIATFARLLSRQSAEVGAPH
ncbi:NAD(P)H-dependent oxidoreductase [Gordonia sp. ABSL1-1]|uniref:CE1759 family FMN reductase n=1 Tax=Gordonia sp. ABSL1-1 TaxID=3053923 RepID=UPI0025729631|nr:CE1759 family FMN reductase [Gordonia sp. ABSL1-1]MDL9936660.1 NAD(P)H-dependent oxidoreductase [Gordonia sp. ABSL1-1]